MSLIAMIRRSFFPNRLDLLHRQLHVTSSQFTKEDEGLVAYLLHNKSVFDLTESETLGALVNFKSILNEQAEQSLRGW
jgi:hypothetical protein